MKNSISDIPIISFSVKVYQILLLAYPTRFRDEYSSEMLQVFRDSCLRTFQQNRWGGMTRLWALTLLDLMRSLVAEHLHTSMHNPAPFVSFSGWALMLGAVTLLPWLITATMQEAPLCALPHGWYVLNNISVFGFFYGLILISIGMIGLRMRFGKLVGPLGKSALLTAAFGAATPVFISIVVGIVEVLPKDYFSLGEPVISYLTQSALIGGSLLLFLSLLLFGILTLIRRPFSQGNGLPLVVGLVLPLLLKEYGNFVGIRFFSENPVFLLISVLGLIMTTVALMWLGYILQADEPPTTVNLQVEK